MHMGVSTVLLEEEKEENVGAYDFGGEDENEPDEEFDDDDIEDNEDFDLGVLESFRDDGSRPPASENPPLSASRPPVENEQPGLRQSNANAITPAITKRQKPKIWLKMNTKIGNL